MPCGDFNSFQDWNDTNCFCIINSFGSFVFLLRSFLNLVELKLCNFVTRLMTFGQKPNVENFSRLGYNLY
jgi:hypothetical protein